MKEHQAFCYQLQGFILKVTVSCPTPLNFHQLQKTSVQLTISFEHYSLLYFLSTTEHCFTTQYSVHHLLTFTNYELSCTTYFFLATVLIIVPSQYFIRLQVMLYQVLD